MTLFTLVAALIPSLLLLWFFHSRDVHREPLHVVWKTFVLGVIIVLPILFVASFLKPLVHSLVGQNPILLGLATAFILAAIPEEIFKYLVLSRYAMRHQAFDEPMDGVVYGVAASLGFATLENVLYVSDGGYSVAIIRAITAVPAHAMMGAIMGYYVGQATVRPAKASSLMKKALWWPVVLHGLYDSPLMVLNNLGPDNSVGGVVLGVLSFITVMVVMITWTTRIVRSLRAEQLQKNTVYKNYGVVGWVKMILGGAVLTVTGLWTIGFILDVVNGGGLGVVIAIVTILIPGVGGLVLFKSGIKHGT